MKTIGIDQSFKRCAVIILDENENVIFFETITAGDGDVFAKANEVAMHVCGVVSTTSDLKIIAIEGLAFGDLGNATRDLAGLQFVIITALRYRLCIPQDIVIIPPPTLKKFATENGRADKQMMIDALPEVIRNQFKEAGYKKTTGLSDLTDAYWLARFAQINY